MRKMIFLAVAGFLWRKVRARVGRRMFGGARRYPRY